MIKCQGNCNNCKKHLGDCKAYEEVFNELQAEIKETLEQIKIKAQNLSD